jgi:hypothetical protein
VCYTVATDFYITSPYDLVSWKAGRSATISWDIVSGGPHVSTISVDLMDGNDSEAHVIQNIATGLSPDTTSVQWKVPQNFPSMNTAFLRVRGEGGKKSVQRFSHRFEIFGSSKGSSDLLSLATKPASTETTTTSSGGNSSSTIRITPTEQLSIPSVTVKTVFRRNEAVIVAKTGLLCILSSVMLVFLGYM